MSDSVIHRTPVRSLFTTGKKYFAPRAASPMFRVYLLAALTAVSLPFIYDIIIRAAVPDDDYGFRHQLHIILTVAATIAGLVTILCCRGDFQARLKTGLLSVLLNFGVLMVLIIAMRMYYSRPLLIAAFFATIAIQLVFNMMIERHRVRRIGIVPNSFDFEMRDQIDRNAFIIGSPDEPSSGYDVVLIDWERVRDPAWVQFATRAILSGREVHHISAYIENRQSSVVPEHFEIAHAPSPRNSLYLMIYKRLFDVILIVLVSPIALLITGFAAAAIALKMGRPILFTQQRVGVDGRPFKMYKLRSMTTAKAGDGETATKMGDARITPLGAFLRRFRIDELPQFYNILAGDMSLVGPRPEQPELARAYTNRWPQFSSRTVLRPGITGWAQVRGKYAADEAETKQKLALDLYYLKHASLIMDLSILFQTFKTLLTGNSAR